MSDYLTNDIQFSTDDFPVDLEVLPIDAIALTDAQMDQARLISQRVTEDNRWQAYLNALALSGFKTWLQQREPDIALNSQLSRMLQSSSSEDAATVICNISANHFKLCLLGNGGSSDHEFAIPTAAVDHLDFIAHFYVPIQVYEELGQVQILGFLSYAQLSQHRQTTRLAIAPDNTYRLPLSWFESDANRLLLQLSCLDPVAIPLPSQVRTSRSSLNLTPLRQIVVEPVVNAGLWVQQQWDQLAQEVGWLLLPPLELAGGTRSSIRSRGVRSQSVINVIKEFNILLANLENRQVVVSKDARPAYRELTLGETPLRLYAVTTAIAEPNTEPEWSLLLILTAADHANLPTRIQLQVCDLNHAVIDRVSKQQSDSDYLYTHVIGSYNEQFLVSLSLPNGESLMLPPFAFQPQA